MRYELAVNAYDVLDQVHVTASLRVSDDQVAHSAVWLQMCSTDVAGVGETDMRQWCVDALVAALEAL